MHDVGSLPFETTLESGRAIAIVGGGFSGVLLAIHLLRQDPSLHVRLIERAAPFGLGRAYRTANPDHLLNVRAANMSAFPDQPDHFQAWLARGGGGNNAAAFVSRERYGEYLQSLLAEELGDPNCAGRLDLIGGDAVSAGRQDGRWLIGLSDCRGILADALVLALGLPTAAPPPAEAETLSAPGYRADPWTSDLSTLPGPKVLLLGSGLTMIDVALSLSGQGRVLTALSRRGLTPLSHAPTRPLAAPTGPLASPLQALRTLRAHARNGGWREAVDSIRPFTTDIWRSWDERQRRRFLRHGQAWWDIHRHRTAPCIAMRLAQMRATGELDIQAGRLQALRYVGSRFEALIRPRGAQQTRAERFDAVVNCASPRGAAAALGAGLLGDLARNGFVRAEALQLGLDVDPSFAAIGANGAATPGLFVVGPLTRGRFWEAIAVPDLRTQTARAAVDILFRMRIGLGVIR